MTYVQPFQTRPITFGHFAADDTDDPMLLNANNPRQQANERWDPPLNFSLGDNPLETAMGLHVTPLTPLTPATPRLEQGIPTILKYNVASSSVSDDLHQKAPAGNLNPSPSPNSDPLAPGNILRGKRSPRPRRPVSLPWKLMWGQHSAAEPIKSKKDDEAAAKKEPKKCCVKTAKATEPTKKRKRASSVAAAEGGPAADEEAQEKEEENLILYALNRVQKEEEAAKKKAKRQRRTNKQTVEEAAAPLPPASPPSATTAAPKKTGSSKYLGVSWSKHSRKWRTQLWTPGRGIKHVGFFIHETEAAAAHGKAKLDRDASSANKDEEATTCALILVCLAYGHRPTPQRASASSDEETELMPPIL